MKLTSFVCAAMAAAASLAGASASASQLTFNDIGYNLNDDYGDAISSSMQDGIRYYTGGQGYTPNVNVEYSDNDLRISNGYGNLSQALWNANEGEDFSISFVADDGFNALLYSFEIGAYGSQDLTIGAIEFLDGDGNVLAMLSDVIVEAGLTRTVIDLTELLGAPVVGSTVTLLFRISGLGSSSDNLGFDNFTFAQEEVLSTPIPAGLPLFLSGMAALGFLRRKRTQA